MGNRTLPGGLAAEQDSDGSATAGDVHQAAVLRIAEFTVKRYNLKLQTLDAIDAAAKEINASYDTLVERIRNDLST